MRRLLYIILLTIFIAGCLEDNIGPKEYEYYNSADLISYVEVKRRSYFTERNSFLITADELYENLAGYYIVDVRHSSEFSNGHIMGAVNVSVDNLLDHFATIEHLNYSKIIIISKTGQRAAYAVSLLRLCGYDNVYSLNFGMGQWNKEFSSPWIESRNDSKYKSQLHLQDNPKPKVEKELPSISLSDPELPIDTLLKIRIKEILYDQKYDESLSNIDELETFYSIVHRRFDNAFIICFGDLELYKIQQIIKDIVPGPIIYGGHPRDAVLYSSIEEFKSSEYLLSLPVNTKIYIYSYNGQESSYINAYLNLLGYDSKSIEFGAVNMFYYHMKFNLFSESFWEDEIRDYPFVK